MTSFCFIQPTLDSLARKNWFDCLMRVVNRYFILVEARCFGSIRFFLADAVQTVSLAEAFQLGTKGKDRDLNEVLIIAFAQICTLLESWVVSHNNRSNLSTETEINYVPRSFIEVIVNLVFASIRQPSFFLGQVLDTLFVFVRNKFGATLIKPLVFRLEPTSINDKGFVGRANDSSKVIQPQVNRYRLFFGSTYLLFHRLVNKCSIQKSTFLLRQYSDFLNSFTPSSLEERSRRQSRSL